MMCAVLALAAGVVYLLWTTGRCAGTLVTVNVAASEDHAPVLRDLAQRWSAEQAAGCEAVEVRAVAPGTVAAAMNPQWDEARDGARPDVWAPDSSGWLLVVAARPEAAAIVPQDAPSLASSPLVLAMQRPMAEALGWPDKDIDLAALLTAFVGGQTWAGYGHPEWGALRVGMIDPTTSAAGQAGVLSVLDPNNDNTMSSEELYGGVAFAQFVTAAAPNPKTLMDPYRQAADAAALPAVFPAFERDVAEFAAGDPAIALVPIYPKTGAAYADYPFAILRAPWVDATRERIARDFLTYARGPQGRAAYGAAGLRAADHSISDTKVLAPDLGFRTATPASQRKPTVQSLSELLGMWTVLQRRNNVLLALDTSGSMNDQLPGANISRLQMLQRAAIEGISLLNNQTVIGLWEFATNLTPTSDYRELVPVGVAGDQLGQGTRRQAMINAIQRLTPRGDTGLYDTVLAAYQAMHKAWQADAQNLMVVITDGRNDDDSGVSFEQLTAELKALVRADRPLWVIAIAVGPEADVVALEAITKITGGSTFVARDNTSAIQQIVLAFAGRPA